MAWSTRELAELTGTTVNTIRHYHRLGLLEEPERRHNGYKQYGVPELVRLLRIRRLVELGVPLARIAGTGELSPEALRQVDADLAADIERLARSRSGIAAILRDGAPADTPAGFESAASRLSPADMSLIHVYQRLYDEKSMADLRKLVETQTGPRLTQHLIDYPRTSDPAVHLSRSEQVTRQTYLDAVSGLYHPARSC